jgi:hyaluronan synthase
MNKILQYLPPFIVFNILIIPIILQHVFKWNLSFSIYNHRYNISIYGIYLLSYLSLQFVLSFLNNRNIHPKHLKYIKQSEQNATKTNILVVGYKENIIYYTMCLESIKTCLYNAPFLNKIYIIIDGNSSDDKYMVDIFLNTFSDYDKKTHINLSDTDINVSNTNLDTILSNLSTLKSYSDLINQNNIICISQPHAGKRFALFTGFQLSLLENKLYNTNIETVFCTDSDTIISPDTIISMLHPFSNPSIGAVTGNLSIYNKYDSVISFLTYIRYWFAFNLERAYQSFSGSVLCVSGPIGMYRLSSLEKIIVEWHTQTFLGNSCTYGDDRHLTNKILSLYEYVLYTPLAFAETETPSTIYRYYKQQIRWSKSAFREFFWTLPILHKHSIFMSIDLIYMFLYPYAIMTYLFYILWTHNLFELSTFFIIINILGIIKSIYSVVITHNFEYLFYTFYVIPYICIVFPAKLHAIFSIKNISWGTSSRKHLNTSIEFDIITLILWNLSIISGVLYTILYNYYNYTFDLYTLLHLSIPSSIFVLYFIIMYIYVKFRKSNHTYMSKTLKNA